MKQTLVHYRVHYEVCCGVHHQEEVSYWLKHSHRHRTDELPEYPGDDIRNVTDYKYHTDYEDHPTQSEFMQSSSSVITKFLSVESAGTQNEREIKVLHTIIMITGSAYNSSPVLIIKYVW